MKFVVIRDAQGIETPHFAVAPVTHRQLADAWLRQPGRSVVSAGFVEIHADKAHVFGRSESLDLGPRLADAALITAFYRATVRMARTADAAGAPEIQPSTSTGASAP